MIGSTLAHMAAMSPSLAYRPFLDPIPIDDYRLVLLLPLVFAVALVYKTIKLDDLKGLLGHALHLAGQIVVFMALAAAALWLLGALV